MSKKVLMIGLVMIMLIFSGCTDEEQKEEENQPPEVTVSADPTTVYTFEAVSFSGTAIDSDGTIMKYEWDFEGDGIYDYGSVTSAATTYYYLDDGRYTATMLVTDDDGATNTASLSIIVNNQAPLAYIDRLSLNTEVYATETVDFNGGSSSDDDGLIKSYSWDFGDPDWEYLDTSTEEAPSYTYDMPGIYTVNLTVTDDDDAIDSDWVDITVLNDISILITDADWDLFGDYYVDITMTNHGNDDASTYYLWFDIVDTDGGKYTANGDSGEKPDYLTKDASASWTIYFDIPSDKTPETLIYQDSYHYAEMDMT